MKRILKVLAVLLVIWLGITFYFITQHTVRGKESQINKTIEFDDVTIELESLVFYNFERKGPNFDTDYETEKRKFKYKLLSKLPYSLVMPYSKIAYLYSSPYEIKKSYTISLVGKCMFTQPVHDSTEYNEFQEYNDYMSENLSINLVDSIGVTYSNGVSKSYEDNSHYIDFSIFDRNLSMERFQEGMTVIIKHLGSRETREFKINPKDFTDFKHNDSFGKAFPDKLRL